jgi:hypothetical protein
MKKPQNVTYLFGAGASCQAIPMVNRISAELEHFAGILRSNTLQGQSDGTPNEQIKEQLLVTLEQVLVGIAKFGTIDGYAKQLWLTIQHTQLTKVKAAISYYFTVRQLGPAGIFMDEERSFFEKVDGRYYQLLSRYMKPGINGPELPSNINVLTWNYDFQIEMTLMKTHELDYVSEVFDRVAIVPDISHRNSGSGQILHLNGIAGSYVLEDGRYQSIYDRHAHTADIAGIMSECIFVIQSANRGQVSFNDTFAFAWENSAVSQKAIETAKHLLRKTDTLVVVGYSFPYYNTDVDRELISSMNLNAANKKLFYQDPNASSVDLVEMFDLLEFEPNYRLDCGRFLVPPGY